MKSDVIQNRIPRVETVKEFEDAIGATEYLDKDAKLYTVVKIPKLILKDVEKYLEGRVENAQPRDFDDDGYLETYTEEGEDSIESLLSHLFTVKAEKNEYEVTITVRVEAFTEEEAEEEVNNNLNDYEWNVEVSEV